MFVLSVTVGCSLPIHREHSRRPPTPSSVAAGEATTMPSALPSPPVSTATLPPVVTPRAPLVRTPYAEAEAALAHGDVDGAAAHAEHSISLGGRGALVLAHVWARRGAAERALEWLERAALDEGVDPRVIDVDADFALLRNDGRWPAVRSFLDAASSYGVGHPHPRTAIRLPPNARKGVPLDLVLGLPPDGGDPDDYVDERAFRRQADALGIAFAAVSGTVSLGPKAYRWSVLSEDNARRVSDGLDEVRAGMPMGVRSVVLLGFGEGAQVAIETVARDPARYAGAIAMSPGGPIWQLDEVPATDHPGRYVIAMGTLERFDVVGTSYADASSLHDRDASVLLHPAWLYARHTLPPDFDTEFPRWFRFVETGKEP